MLHLSGRTRRATVLVLAAVVFLVGLTLVVMSQPTADVGWAAYSPLADSFPGGRMIVVDARTVVGLVLAAVGLAGGAGLAGFALGRRQRVHPQSTSTAPSSRS